MSLTQKQQDYLKSLYQQGLRNPWHITEKDYIYLQSVNDFKELWDEAQLFILNLDIELRPEIKTPKQPVRKKHLLC